MIFAAITGSIGCGKTTISNILRKQGFLVYDIDKWVKLLYYKKDFLAVISKYFPEVFDENGIFNKRALRNLVFSNSDKLKILESLVHPFLTARLRRIIRQNRNNGIVFVDVALLYEMGWDKFFDYVVLADVEYEVQKLRVMKRDNVSAEDFEKINKVQMPQEEKRKKADFIVDTNASEGKLVQQLLCVIEEM